MPPLFRLFLFMLLLFTMPMSSALGQDEQRVVVEIRTELGKMTIELYNETPQHRDNFLKLMKADFYDGLLFHRIIPRFMVQGGDPGSRDAKAGEPLGSGGPGYTVEAEILPGIIHKKGALSAARQGDDVNPERRSNGSQFYIVQGKKYSKEELSMLEQRLAARDPGLKFSEEQLKAYTTVGGAPHLDGGYTVFGEVVDGLEVMAKLTSVQCDGLDRPLQDIRMTIRARK